MKNNNELSIIIPAYNEEKVIDKCLKAVFKIKKLKLNVIVVDDGSTDNSWATINSLQKRNNNIKALTNSFSIATKLLNKNVNDVTIPGGRIYEHNSLILSPFNFETIKHYHASKLFLSCLSINEIGLLEDDENLAKFVTGLINISDEIILLIDDTKFYKNDGSFIVIVTFILSIIGVFAFRYYARQKLYSEGKLLETRWTSVGIFFIPTLIIYFALGSPIGLEYPELKGFNFKGGIHARGSLISLWFALSIYTGAFIAEVVRAGIQSVDKGQSEAAGALGMRPNFIMNLVISVSYTHLTLPTKA